jgi:hypothetical protein
VFGGLAVGLDLTSVSIRTLDRTASIAFAFSW